MILQYRPVTAADIKNHLQLSLNAQELFYMFPKAQYPLTEAQLSNAVLNGPRHSYCLRIDPRTPVKKPSYCVDPLADTLCSGLTFRPRDQHAKFRVGNHDHFIDRVVQLCFVCF